jgi:hypothetical protein
MHVSSQLQCNSQDQLEKPIAHPFVKKEKRKREMERDEKEKNTLLDK